MQIKLISKVYVCNSDEYQNLSREQTNYVRSNNIEFECATTMYSTILKLKRRNSQMLNVTTLGQM